LISQPLVSVIIPTYNYAHYILRAIDSVLMQNYPVESIEILVVDDGSTDATKDVLSEYIELNKIKYIYQTNQGKAKATHTAIQASQGHYIFNLDADDYFLIDKIATTVELYQQDPTLVHIASPAIIEFSETNISEVEKFPFSILDKVLNGNKLLRYFYSNNILFGGGSTFSAKAIVLKALNIPAGVDMYIDEFLLLATLPYGNCYLISKPLSVWFVHGKNYSATVSKNLLANKNERLLNSSMSVLKYLQDYSNNQYLIKMYDLQNANRIIYFKEQAGNKSFADILLFCKTIFFKHCYSPFILIKYSVFNRLIPQKMLNFLKHH
jgi:glycosyltransferase involved in cell wall biosynthesis